MPGIIGKKIGMTSIFTDDGKNVACTVIQAGPCIVTQIKTQAGKDGYDAVQLGFDDKKEKHTTAAMVGHFKKASTQPKRIVAEFRGTVEGWKVGDVVGAAYFADNLFVDIVGVSKGKGFQGVVKRHGFGGVGSRTHGQHDRQRAPGSLGGSSYPSRVLKGLRMAGRDGGKTVKVLNLQVVKILTEHNLILVKGSVPGAIGSYVKIEK